MSWQYLKLVHHQFKAIFDYAQSQDHLEVGWVWNRSLDKLVDLDEDLILEDLEDIDDMPKKV